MGAGTGILSEAAALAGASRVIAIERADIVKQCIKMVRKSGLGKTIKVMQTLAEEAPLDPASVDVIVSEWMGYFLLFERMLPSVLKVRDLSLKPGGIMIPGRFRMLLACSDKNRNDSLVPDIGPTDVQC